MQCAVLHMVGTRSLGSPKSKALREVPRRTLLSPRVAALMGLEQVLCARNLLTSLMSLSLGVLGEGLFKTYLWGQPITAMGLLQ